ncbi:MAG: L-fucokinase [Opitutaceae bacterium]|nr:L-fucokinase [Opitutaceae bacterium]
MFRTLVSVPPGLDRFLRFGSATGRGLITRDIPHAFISSDPAGERLGSGGGSVALLHGAWRAGPRPGTPLIDWLNTGRALVVHAGGESRRLPAYAAIGKAMLPVPPLEEYGRHRFDQTLADFQLPHYGQVLREAGPKASALVASGDVWLDFNPLRIRPVDTDITGIGMRVTPEVAQHFGVYFVGKQPADGNTPLPIAFFLQKPAPETIYHHLPRYDFFVDTGLWLLSTMALRFLFRLCGWDESRQTFRTGSGHPRFLDLYSEIGPILGQRRAIQARFQRAGWSKITTSVIPLENARFFHLGSNRQLFESFEHLTGGSATTKLYRSASPAPKVVAQPRSPVWLDGVATQSEVELHGFNIVTGVPVEAAALCLEPHWCLDVAPVGRNAFVFRPYALDDTLRGRAGEGATICGQDAAQWMNARGLEHSEADLFDVEIYPLIPATGINQSLLDWFFAPKPDPNITKRVLRSRRLCAAEIPTRLNFRRYFADRVKNHATALVGEFVACRDRGDTRVFAQDFTAMARLSRQGDHQLVRWLSRNKPAIARPEYRSRYLMLAGQIQRGKKSALFVAEAHQQLQTAIVSSAQLSATRPRLALKEDQIVWARSPVRLDLAGGWTDTPPYCLEFGGAVLNVAVLLNGQPPIQVFIRPVKEPIIRLRSIDLGVGETIATNADLAGFRDPRSGFSLAKAALALAGFLPRFSSGKADRPLKDRLRAFGGGLEISLLSAVPKGSGLGTSSILGATLLGALNRTCSLGWDEVNLYRRVLAVEQLLTTGGGWQDQAGALFRGLKLIQTTPGLTQTPSVRYLPGHVFDADHANRTLLLYYTGITRLAKGILKEIVHDMFLGRFETLQTLNLIRQNALELFGAIQQDDAVGFCRCIARSWDLNKRLDPGTSTPAVERLLLQCGDDLAAAKLLGAGGGGYMLLCARDAASGRRIRERLENRPPNRRARFIGFELADRGLEVTVS